MTATSLMEMAAVRVALWSVAGLARLCKLFDSLVHKKKKSIKASLVGKLPSYGLLKIITVVGAVLAAVAAVPVVAGAVEALALVTSSSSSSSSGSSSSSSSSDSSSSGSTGNRVVLAAGVVAVAQWQ